MNSLDNSIELFRREGLELIQTCSSCPEQYDVKKEGQMCGYIRLRSGRYTVEWPEVMKGMLHYDVLEGNKDSFDEDERETYLTKALIFILRKLKANETI